MTLKYEIFKETKKTIVYIITNQFYIIGHKARFHKITEKPMGNSIVKIFHSKNN